MGLRWRVLIVTTAASLVAPLVAWVLFTRAVDDLRAAWTEGATKRLEQNLQLTLARFGGVPARVDHLAEALTERLSAAELALDDLVGPAPTRRARARRTQALRILRDEAERSGLDAWALREVAPPERPGEPRGAGDPRLLAMRPTRLAEGPAWWALEGETALRASLALLPQGGALVARTHVLLAARAWPRRALLEELATVAEAPRLKPHRPGAPESGTLGRARVALRGDAGTPIAWVEAAPPDRFGTVSRSVRRALLLAALVGFTAAAAVGGIAGWLLAAPLGRLARALDLVTEDAMPPRPLPTGPGEVGRVARAVERTLARLAGMERRRAAAERRAAWEQVARRVAHEVKNPLTPIRLAVDNMERAAGRGVEKLAASLPEESAAIRSEVARLERLVREFSEYARLPRPQPAPADLSEVVLPALRSQVGAEDKIRVVPEVEPDLPPALVDADLLGAAVVNLARNAVEAMGDAGGRIRLSIRRLEARGRDGLLVEIADDGPGIPEALRERLFEPYVTGRAGQGTGLGLAVARRIVEEHGGTLEARDLAEGGACFVMTLPVAA